MAEAPDARGKVPAVIAVLLSPVATFTGLCAISAKMLAWRVSHEPGFDSSDGAGFLFATICCLAIGLMLTVAVHIVLIKYRPVWLLWAWLLNVLAGIVYVPVFAVTMMMMA